MRKSLKKKNGIWLAPIYAISCLALIFTTPTFAEKSMTWEGTIQGLNCTHYQLPCPQDDLDMYIALENDFVLVTSDGKHYLLPNLSILIKARYLTQNVRISGEKKGDDSIWAKNLEVKMGNTYNTVWNYEEQKRRRREQENIWDSMVEH
jgi:hypothetical protein